MKRVPILIMCLGGQGASVLARTFHACGMEVGNSRTFWEPYYLNPHCEHSMVTAIMGDIYLKDATLSPKETWEPRLREILRSYKSEAERLDWKYYGIKTTSGICNTKWKFGVADLLAEEWPEALYFGVIRKPDIYYDLQNDAYNSVYQGRKGIAERGGVFVRFPEAWQDGSIRDIIEATGLEWNEEAMAIFNEPIENKMHYPTDEELAAYFEKWPEEKEKRDYVMGLSAENFKKMKEQFGGKK